MLAAGLFALLTAPAHAEDECAAASQYIYVMTSDRGLHRFNPLTGDFSLVGKIKCPAGPSSRPYSMAVSRSGMAYVVFEYGELFAVDTTNASCKATGFKTGQQGFTAFGMGFTRGPGGEDTLYISTRSKVGGQGYKLGQVDLSNMTVRTVGVFDQVSARSELTGSSKGELFGAFEGDPFRLGHINPNNAKITAVEPLSAARFSPDSANFAFAQWGGNFYLFAGPGSGSDVFLHTPRDGITAHTGKTALTIVGAGVSTCAPAAPVDENYDIDEIQQPSDNGSVPPPDPTNDNGAGGPSEPPRIQDLQTVITPPDDSGTLAPGETLTVTAGVRDEGGSFIPIDGGTFHVVDGTGAVTDFPGSPRDDGQVEATVTLPADSGDATITFTPTVSLTPQQRLQPEDASAVTLKTDWALSWTIGTMPATCYTNQPCTGTATLVRSGPAADRILQAPQGRVVHIEDGQPVSADPFPDDLSKPLTFTRTYTSPATVTWQLGARATTGQVDSDVHTIEVREPIVLKVGERIDFGTLPAGTAPKATCATIDLAGSSGLAGAQLRLSPQNMAAGCESTLQLLQGGNTSALTEPRTVAADQELSVCLSVPFCAADASPAGAGLEVAATDPAFADQEGTVALSWQVTEKSWLSCNGAWFWPLVGGLSALFVVVGFIKPRRFPIGSHVVTAGSLKGLKRGSPVELRTASGGRAGFYRDARLGIHADGSVNGKSRGAVALLRATSRGVRLEPKGPVEVYNKRRRQWTSPEQAGLIEPSPTEIFRVGELYFQVEPG